MFALPRWNHRIRRAVLYAATLALRLASAQADPGTHPECDNEAVAIHVLGQLAIYGPLSSRREYFGFVYRLDGELASAVTRGEDCTGQNSCFINIGAAGELIPPGAKVLGEWHTHPHFYRAEMLSMLDVRGARQNSRVRCYAAYYAASSGKIYSWNPHSTSVPTAMGTRNKLGNYRDEAREPGTQFAAAER